MTQRVQQQAESRHQRLLDRRAIAKAMEEKKQRAEEEAERLRLETAAILIEFSQQEFIRDTGTQTSLQLTNNQQIQTCSQSTSHQEQQTAPTNVIDSSQQTDSEEETPSNTFRASMIRGNDSLTQQYIGLPSWSVFFHVVMFLTPFANPAKSLALTIEDEIFDISTIEAGSFL